MLLRAVLALAFLWLSALPGAVRSWKSLCLSKSEFRLHAAIFLLILFTACQKENIEIDTIAQLDFGGQVSKIETLGYYSAAEAILVLQTANPEGRIETTNGYYLYRITYKSTNFDRTPILVLGLMAVPNTKNIKRLAKSNSVFLTYCFQAFIEVQ